MLPILSKDGSYGAGEVLENINGTKSNEEEMPCCHFEESGDANEEETLKLLVRLKKSPRRVFLDQNME